MNRTHSVVGALCASMLLKLGSAIAAPTDIVSTYLQVDCWAATLLWASGVHDAGPVAKYQFRGVCYISRWGETERKVLGPRFIEHVSGEIKVDGDAMWARATGEAQEKLQLSGAFTGEIRTWYVDCYDDPFLESAELRCKPTNDNTASVAAHAGVKGIPPGQEVSTLSGLVLEKRWPYFARAFDPNEAKAMSYKYATEPPPASSTAEPEPVEIVTASESAGGSVPVAAGPPQMVLPNLPSSGTPTSGSVPSAGGLDTRGYRPQQITIEAEGLSAQASVSIGQLAIQDMTPFGTLWSGNRQLFWSGGQTGAVLDLTVNVPEPGTYAVVLRLTRAPDYGDLKFELAGNASPIGFPGYAAQVGVMDAPIGTYTLAPGPQTLGIMIAGKQAASTGFFAGIDRIMLTKLATAR